LTLDYTIGRHRVSGMLRGLLSQGREYIAILLGVVELLKLEMVGTVALNVKELHD
jgi:hypothetical protein